MKKNRKLISIVALALTVMLAFAACGKEPEPPKQQQLNDVALTKNIVADFTKTAADRSEFFESNGWENGEPFNAYWNAENVSYANNKLALSISKMPTAEKGDRLADYYAGEARSTHYYGYGDFQVRMKPSKVAGTASTFFTCTGPYDEWFKEDGTVERKNPHDEIDIEFLGKDTTHVQFNYFANGKGGHEYMYDLGFDASLEYHDYGYRWTADYITWFVDNKPVYRVDRANIKAGETWPSEPGRIIMNHWSATAQASAWMGAFNDVFTGSSDYLWASTTATAKPDPASTKPGTQPEESEPIPTDIVWDAITAFPFADTSGGGYTVTSAEEGKKLTVTYTNINGTSYSNIRAAVSSANRNYVGLTLTGKTDKSIGVRFNVRGGGKNIAKKAYISEGKISIDDGALCTVPANGSINVAVYYEGAMDSLELMIDSTHANATAATNNANTLEISGMKLGLKGELVEPPVDANKGVLINDENIKFAAGDYTIESDGAEDMTVSYTDIPGKGYKFIIGDVSAIIADNNTFTFTVTNNGAETAKIRADILCPAGNGTTSTQGGEVNQKNDFCNINAVAPTLTGENKGNDYDWNGADWFKIATGETATITITFTTGVGAYGVRFYIDSSTYNDEGKHTGEIVFSAMNFTKVSSEIPEPPKPGEGINILDEGITFGAEWAYTVTPGDGDFTVTYNDISGKGYSTVVSDSIAAIVGDNNAFTFNVTNNGNETVKIRVDINCEIGKGTSKDGGEGAFSNLSSTATGIVAKGNDYAYGGADWFTIAKGETATITIIFATDAGSKNIMFYIDSSTYNDEGTHTGEVVFSDMFLSKTPGEGINILDEGVTFSAEWAYTVTPGDGDFTVTYNDISGKGYSTVVSDSIAALVGDNNAFTFNVTNNGDETVKIRVDIECEAGKGTAKDGGAFSNLSANATGIVTKGNDYAYGGADWFTIAKGETATITIIFAADAGSKGITFFIDSSTYNDEGTHTGEVVFSDLFLSTIA